MFLAAELKRLAEPQAILPRFRGDWREYARDLAWAILNCAEFGLNH